ncbi:MAG: stage V sporulation protein AD, partial [Lachnospiraceae bacterium]|nr:stage V sporulation protein AD [Lachnospiraceae bacterium]
DMDVDSGGSGCGCSASVLNGYVYEEISRKRFNKVLFMSTGALLSPTSSMQKDTIPGVSHCVVLERID